MYMYYIAMCMESLALSLPSQRNYLYVQCLVLYFTISLCSFCVIMGDV